jgi:ubiquinone/menaquinone biosynthesis C-methylase UbiE
MDSFSTISSFYDLIYYKSDIYEREANLVKSFIQKYKQTQNDKLLDIACGTGTHIKFFMPVFKVFGLDNSKEMLHIAQNNYPNIKFFNENMINFKIDIKFGAIICLFGSIGLVQSIENLRKAIKSFSRHLETGGILILVPWSTKELFKEKIVSDKIKIEDKQVVRMEKVEKIEDDKVKVTYHYLIGKDNEIEYHKGNHPLIGLFSEDEYVMAIKKSQLEIVENYIGKNIQMGKAFVCRKLEGYST